jgi:quinoprotein dehydrogenase-associated probable ABC transporter substrate-binding protein
MSLPFLSLLFVISTASAVASPLRVCADPDNLPFSNHAAQGFDNRIAQLIARDLHREAVFVWARAGQGFVREVFNKNACDMMMGVPTQFDRVLTSTPYYRSTYVTVAPAKAHLKITGFVDSRLNGKRIGLQRLQEDYSPASLPLIRTGRRNQIVGFSSFGEAEGEVVRAAADGRVDVSYVWGPVAAYFIHHDHLPLTMTPVSDSQVPLAYSISVGLHKRDTRLKASVGDAIRRLAPQIRRILAETEVPTLPQSGGGS